jgi:hypothetical protein
MSLLLVALGVAPAAPTEAAVPQALAGFHRGAEIAVGEDGGAFLVDAGGRVARLRSADPGARFRPPRALVRAGGGDRPVDAGVAADGSGVIVVQRDRGARRSVRVARFRRGGRPAMAATVSTGRGSADFAASAVADSGAAIIAWFRHRADGRWRLEAAVRGPGHASFGAPEPLSPYVRRPCCTLVSVAAGESGDAVATWRSTSRSGAWAALRRSGRRFGRTQRIAEDPVGVPRAVAGAGGVALVYGIQRVPPRPGDGPQLRRAQSDGTFGAAEPVDAGCEASSAEAALLPAGSVLVACVSRQDARVHLFEAPPGGPLRPVGALGARVPAQGRPALAADRAGRAIVAWSQPAPGRARRELALAAVRPAPGAPFGPDVALGRARGGAEPLVARLVPRGGALVVWRAGRRTHRARLFATRLP